jgi:hypothetical protein
MKKSARSRGKKKEKPQSDITCENCKKSGHGKPNCYAKEGGKEVQGPLQQQKAKGKEPKTTVVAMNDEEGELFAFTCTSNYAAVADILDVPKSKLGTCIDSGVT